MALTSDMVQLLDAGVAHQVAGCTNAGRPVVCRGLAAQLEADEQARRPICGGAPPPPGLDGHVRVTRFVGGSEQHLDPAD